MSSLQLVATAAFGLEAVVVRQLRQMGYAPRVTRPGRITFTGETADICRANLWLRSADRVLVQLGQFPAADFDALFEQTRNVPWEEWIARDAAIPVRGRSRKSQLTSVPACQRTVKKAIVERLSRTSIPAAGEKPACSRDTQERSQDSRSVGASLVPDAETRVRLPETGPPVPVEVAILDDEAILSIDTSGDGLHKRGYRSLSGPAQIRETLAAALVELSAWKPGRPFLDPFCGTGTIVIEAAMIAQDLAPGRQRTFAAENWSHGDALDWKRAREEADDLAVQRAHAQATGSTHGNAVMERLIGTDADGEALKLARYHAERAGVADCVHFQQRDFADTLSKRQFGCLVTNPPYGMRLGDDSEIEALYQSMPGVLRRLTTWSHFILSARDDLERLVGQEADRRRKLYNGGVRCTYFQFFGPRPPANESDPDAPSASARSVRVAEPEVAESEPLPKPTTCRRSPQAFGGLRVEASRQATEFANRLRKRARHLRRWPTKRGITCYRVYDRDIPEVPVAVDRYEDALHIAEYERPHERTAAEHADWLDWMVRTAAEVLDISRENVFVKYRERQRGPSQYGRMSDAQAVRVVGEGGLKFQVNLSDYVDTGLFLDHRITRQMIRDVAAGKRFLNLFAYTGAFTVYAAGGGAAETTTVDLSANYLDWTRENMRLNGFTGNEHTFHRADVWSFLARLDAKESFDLAVVDPPTYSNSKSLDTDWDIQRDHARLLHRVLAHLLPGGVLFFSTNFRRIKLDEAAVVSSGATVREISRQTVPEDFRNKRIHRCWRIVKK